MIEKGIVAGMALVIMGICFLSDAGFGWTEAANENDWLALNTNVTAQTGYIRVNVSDLVTVNWNNGTLTGGQTMDVDFGTSSWAINTSGNMAEVTDNLTMKAPHQYRVHFSGSPPQTAWIRAGSYDVMRVEIASVGTSMVLNFSVRSEIPDIFFINSTLNATVSKLDAALDLLSDTADRLNSTIINVTQNLSNMSAAINSMRQSISGILAQLDGLTSEVDQMNGTLDHWVGVLLDDVWKLENLTADLSAGTQLTDATLDAYMEYANSSIMQLNDKMKALNSTQISNFNQLTGSIALVRESLEQQIAAINQTGGGDIGKVQAELASLRAAILKTNGNVTNLTMRYTSDLDAVGSRLDELGANLSAREAAMQNLSSSVNAMMAGLSAKVDHLSSENSAQDASLRTKADGTAAAVSGAALGAVAGLVAGAGASMLASRRKKAPAEPIPVYLVDRKP